MCLTAWRNDQPANTPGAGQTVGLPAVTGSERHEECGTVWVVPALASVCCTCFHFVPHNVSSRRAESMVVWEAWRVTCAFARLQHAYSQVDTHTTKPAAAVSCNSSRTQYRRLVPQSSTLQTRCSQAAVPPHAQVSTHACHCRPGFAPQLQPSKLYLPPT